MTCFLFDDFIPLNINSKNITLNRLYTLDKNTTIRQAPHFTAWHGTRSHVRHIKCVLVQGNEYRPRRVTRFSSAQPGLRFSSRPSIYKEVKTKRGSLVLHWSQWSLFSSFSLCNNRYGFYVRDDTDEKLRVWTRLKECSVCGGDFRS